MNPCLLSTLESQAHHDAVPGSYRCYDLLVLHAQLSLCALNPCPLRTRCNNAPNLVHQWLACKLYCTPSKAQLQCQMLIQYSGLCVTPTFCPCQWSHSPHTPNRSSRDPDSQFLAVHLSKQCDAHTGVRVSTRPRLPPLLLSGQHVHVVV